MRGTPFGHTISKVENRRMPVAGAMMRATQAIFVDRSDPGSRHAVTAAIRERAEGPRWGPVVVFAEGTTANQQGVVSFKPGAFAPLLPVQLLVVRYGSPCGLDLSWTYGSSLLTWVCMLGTPVVPVQVHWLEPLTPAPGISAADYALLAQRAMARSMGAAATEHGFADVRLQAAALRLQLSCAEAVLECSRLTRLHSGVSVENCMRLLRLHARAGGASGRVTLAGLCDAVCLPMSHPVAPHLGALAGLCSPTDWRPKPPEALQWRSSRKGLVRALSLAQTQPQSEGTQRFRVAWQGGACGIGAAEVQVNEGSGTSQGTWRLDSGVSADGAIDDALVRWDDGDVWRACGAGHEPRRSSDFAGLAWACCRSLSEAAHRSDVCERRAVLVPDTDVAAVCGSEAAAAQYRAAESAAADIDTGGPPRKRRGSGTVAPAPAVSPMADCASGIAPEHTVLSLLRLSLLSAAAASPAGPAAASAL
eukprot:TRINITY_DN27677_c0_g1_i1.p1 TRINITY_DN27677_c0_g1~~TRINITY_DN27677_c0_g1_i1.p1  ORF type:complete len:477 (+),score=60.51 TRINITY_DN27677_c0_g1_i1:554-1984(+)